MSKKKLEAAKTKRAEKKDRLATLHKVQEGMRQVERESKSKTYRSAKYRTLLGKIQDAKKKESK